MTIAVTLLAASAGRAATLDLAWLRDGRVEVRQLDAGGTARDATFDGSRMVPLGSVWKLFVYVYAADSKLPTPDYTCHGRDVDEVYCCEPGQQIGRDAALAQSCGLFFAPVRLGLTRRPWLAYWSARLGRAPGGDMAWLADPLKLTPDRLVRLDSLLRALASIPAASRVDADSALLHVVLGARGAESVRWFGSRLRVKTYSWHLPAQPGERLGGAAGWLADGTPVWLGGVGTSAEVLRVWARPLAAALPAVAPAADAGCVLVDYFARYPIRRISGPGGAEVGAGPLLGRYAVEFENGARLALSSSGELQAVTDGAKRLQVRGRLGVNDYVARVLAREASAEPAEAAKALAIAARTYLQQNAAISEGCQRISDSSATQRVSPNPPGPAERAIAQWTDQLVLAGTTVRYHRDTPGPGTMAWRVAAKQARGGRYFDEILASAYPDAELTTLTGGGGLQCTRLSVAQDWLALQVPRWERVLRAEPGYQRPALLPAVCALAGGAPYSEQSRNRIFVRGLRTREDRITLAHEFLHLGLAAHPRGQDEQWVEQLARRLVDLSLEGAQ